MRTMWNELLERFAPSRTDRVLLMVVVGAFALLAAFWLWLSLAW